MFCVIFFVHHVRVSLYLILFLWWKNANRFLWRNVINFFKACKKFSLTFICKQSILNLWMLRLYANFVWTLFKFRDNVRFFYRPIYTTLSATSLFFIVNTDNLLFGTFGSLAALGGLTKDYNWGKAKKIGDWYYKKLKEIIWIPVFCTIHSGFWKKWNILESV